MTQSSIRPKTQRVAIKVERHHEHGAYLPRPKSSTGWFQAAVRKAKVQRITPHDLRHTCASLAVAAGVNVLALQRILGHKSAKVTLDTCAD